LLRLALAGERLRGEKSKARALAGERLRGEMDTRIIRRPRCFGRFFGVRATSGARGCISMSAFRVDMASAS